MPVFCSTMTDWQINLSAPIDDGSICIWDASARSESQGRLIAKTDVGLLSNANSDLDRDTRLSLSQSIMTETGAVECVSIDNKLNKGFFAVQKCSQRGGFEHTEDRIKNTVSISNYLLVRGTSSDTVDGRYKLDYSSS